MLKKIITTVFYIAFSYFVFAQNFQSDFTNELTKKITQQNIEINQHESDSNYNVFTLASEYLELGNNYLTLTEYNQAGENYDKSYAILKKESKSSVVFADLYSSFSRLFCEIGKYDEAYENAKKALEIYQQLDLTDPEKNKLTFCYNLIAKAQGALGNYEGCLKSAEKALSINTFDDETKIASYHVKGHYLCFMCQFDEGIKILEKALSMKNGIEDLQTADICASLANANRNFGDLYKSLDYCNKELEIYEKYYGIQNVKTASAYRDLGTIYSNFGDYSRAISYIEKAKEIYKKSNIEFGDDLSSCYTNLGAVYRHIGENEKALENLMEALKIDINAYGEIHSSVATCYNNLACVYFDIGDFDNAIFYQEKVIEIDSQIFGEKSPKNIIDYLNMAFFYRYASNNENVEKNYLIALEISRKELGETNPYTAGIYMQLGHFYIDLLKTNEAYDCYEKALDGYKNSFASYEDVLNNVWRFLDSTTNIEYIEKPSAKLIEEMLSVAFDKIEQSRFDNSDYKSDILKYALPLYYYAVQFEKSQNHFDKVFEYSERLRGRGFLDQIGKEAALKLDGITQDEKDDAKKLQNKIEALKSKIKNLYSITESERDNKELFSSIKNLDSVKKQLRALDEKIAKRVPSYKELRNPQTAKAKDAQKWCGKNHAILEYVMYEPENEYKEPYLYCIVLTKNKINVIQLDSNYDYDSAISSLRDAITHRPIKSEVTFEKERNELYEHLIKSVLPYIKNIKDVLIVPDGNLSFLPFDMLRESSGAVDFGKKFSISLSPSVSVSMIADKIKPSSKDMLAFYGAWYDKSLSEEEHSQTLRGNGTRGIDRELSSIDSQTSSMSEEALRKLIENEGTPVYFEQKNLKWHDLPGTVVEVEKLKKTVFTNANTISEKKASEALLKELSKQGELSKYCILHFACHGYFDSALSEMSSVLFSEVSGKLGDISQEDGYLTVGEASTLNLSAQIVCLSACQTGLGENQKGEGMIGLSRAFMVAGAKNVGATLWCVDDEATAEFMARMYKKVKSGMSYSEAYCKVKNEFRNSDEYSHPYYWAAFVLYE